MENINIEITEKEDMHSLTAVQTIVFFVFLNILYIYKIQELI